MPDYVFGQESVFIGGVVLDNVANESIIFTTVGVKGKSKGVITNMNGGFRLPLSFRNIDGNDINT
ncbi:peptidase associated/transthyretin-like domain-containing protein [Maribacter hydrothermalis]|uniref:TonB-dependent receptor n=1 Tax=Maribacter hydrothermalis TaxID=1836467 RepID=A0A1B7Z1G4_9FLAO|nr:hypothetical protein [Maribacter hydrothermalis]APQ18181.1 hypothetical protein BTR34_12995 [Maribacter hydrothermalis]OBR36528.1 hypothetical protein A9200_08885 [Maribacter hydrothermalis]